MQATSGEDFESAENSRRRKRRSAEELRDKILEAAREEFNRSGFSGATTAAIARRAEVTEAQLFRYFASKNDLFREAVFTPLNQHFRDFQARQDQAFPQGVDFREGARRYITELHRFLGENGKLLLAQLVAQTYAPGSARGVGEMDSLMAYFEQGAATLASRTGEDARVDPRLMVRVSFAAVLGATLFQDWLFPDGLASDDEVESAIIDFVIDGIAANPPSESKE